MDQQIRPVILSGGAGSRLWPLSRAKYPKQFLPMLGDKSLFVQTLERVATDYGFAAPVVIANEHHRFLVAEQADKAGIKLGSLILEPVGRNTAPAFALAALEAAKANPDELLLFLPSDHVILDTPGFHKAVKAAAKAAAADHLCCFGMAPVRPETGYGYIRQGDSLEGLDGAFRIAEFTEKPDAEAAQTFLEAGDYSWNSGMFLMRASTLLAELETLEPEMLRAVAAAHANLSADLDFLRVGEKEFAAVPANSIDYAVMERTSRAAVVPAEFGWSDVGSFSSLAAVQQPDAEGNVTSGDVLMENVSNSFIQGDGKMIAAVGVDNLIVVTTDDAVLVASKDQDQDIKKIVERLKSADRIEADFHSTVYRPWGNYRSLAAGDRFQVKEITVYPGKRLSLQKHHHRAEHWVIVEGSAIVTRDDEELLLSENESVYLPLGAVHRLKNPGKIPLKLIEVQSGSYLGEDDIVRLEDDFNREKEG